MISLAYSLENSLSLYSSPPFYPIFYRIENVLFVEPVPQLEFIDGGAKLDWPAERPLYLIQSDDCCNATRSIPRGQVAMWNESWYIYELLNIASN